MMDNEERGTARTLDDIYSDRLRAWREEEARSCS